MLAAVPPSSRFGNMAKTVAAKWGQLDPETKSRFTSLAKKDSLRYKKEMSEWRKLNKPKKARKKSTATSSKKPKKQMEQKALIEKIFGPASSRAHDATEMAQNGSTAATTVTAGTMSHQSSFASISTVGEKVQDLQESKPISNADFNFMVVNHSSSDGNPCANFVSSDSMEQNASSMSFVTDKSDECWGSAPTSTTQTDQQQRQAFYQQQQQDSLLGIMRSQTDFSLPATLSQQDYVQHSLQQQDFQGFLMEQSPEMPSSQEEPQVATQLQAQSFLPLPLNENVPMNQISCYSASLEQGISQLAHDMQEDCVNLFVDMFQESGQQLQQQF